MIDTEGLKEKLNLKPFGTLGWLSSKTLKCPKCGKSKKFGIKLSDNGGAVHCFRDCDYSDSIYRYLKENDLSEFILSESTIKLDYLYELPSLTNIDKICYKAGLEEIALPKGCKEIQDDSYLNKRRFLPCHYYTLKPCLTDSFLERGLHNYYIFQLFQKGKLVAWIARSKYSKEWHRKKEDKGEFVLRYKNAPGIDFTKILGGYDEITETVHTLFVVEGLFDKVGIDFLLELNEDHSNKCVFTFGAKISEEQIELIRETNVQRLIFLYDKGAEDAMIRYGMLYDAYFYIEIGINPYDEDPNEMNYSQLNYILENLKKPFELKLNYV